MCSVPFMSSGTSVKQLTPMGLRHRSLGSNFLTLAKQSCPITALTHPLPKNIQTQSNARKESPRNYKCQLHFHKILRFV